MQVLLIASVVISKVTCATSCKLSTHSLTRSDPRPSARRKTEIRGAHAVSVRTTYNLHPPLVVRRSSFEVFGSGLKGRRNKSQGTRSSILHHPCNISCLCETYGNARSGTAIG